MGSGRTRAEFRPAISKIKYRSYNKIAAHRWWWELTKNDVSNGNIMTSQSVVQYGIRLFNMKKREDGGTGCT